MGNLLKQGNLHKRGILRLYLALMRWSGKTAQSPAASPWPVSRVELCRHLSLASLWVARSHRSWPALRLAMPCTPPPSPFSSLTLASLSPSFPLCQSFSPIPFSVARALTHFLRFSLFLLTEKEKQRRLKMWNNQPNPEGSGRQQLGVGNLVHLSLPPSPLTF